MSDENVEVVEVVEDVVSDQPTVSHEEYLELVSMRQSVLELKAQKSEVLEFVESIEYLETTDSERTMKGVVSSCEGFFNIRSMRMLM